jgi:hypothetical protein
MSKLGAPVHISEVTSRTPSETTLDSPPVWSKPMSSEGVRKASVRPTYSFAHAENQWNDFRSANKGKGWNSTEMSRQYELAGHGKKKTKTTTKTTTKTKTMSKKKSGNIYRDKEYVNETFSKLGATKSGLSWCWNNPSACAIGAVGTGIAAGFAVWWIGGLLIAGIGWASWGMAAVLLGYSAIRAAREKMLKTYDESEEFAALSIGKLNKRIKDLKANQCAFNYSASCRTTTELLKAAEEVLDWQLKICSGGDCAETRALFEDVDASNLSEEEQDELIQKRKDLFFGHIWSQYKDVDDDKIKKLDRNNKKELKQMFKNFTDLNKNIFQDREDGRLVTASLGRGILVGETSTKQILKILAVRQKNMIARHINAIDEWIQLWEQFTEHKQLIVEGDLLKDISPKFKLAMKDAASRCKPESILLESDGDKEEQMTTKLRYKRDNVDRKVEQLQKLVFDMDASDEGSIVSNIQKNKELRDCFYNSVQQIETIFRIHQSRLENKSMLNAEIERANVSLENPKPELMERLCTIHDTPDNEYPKKDAVELAKWILDDDLTLI